MLSDDQMAEIAQAYAYYYHAGNGAKRIQEVLEPRGVLFERHRATVASS